MAATTKQKKSSAKADYAQGQKDYRNPAFGSLPRGASRAYQAGWFDAKEGIYNPPNEAPSMATKKKKSAKKTTKRKTAKRPKKRSHSRTAKRPKKKAARKSAPKRAAPRKRKAKAKEPAPPSATTRAAEKSFRNTFGI
jgi:hypothetical protein